ncbi:unnamed protein product [Dracunculus medinensis]|uniref:Eukaryotic translation initiation factor 2A n=1 Tax=Dracunculus medinensis TaxID=318479 RepID=A0A0N4UCB1_DRAME|nr:unnamed protein product [Dracunculus medinensis]
MSENLCFAVRASDALSLFRGTNSPTSIFQTTANNGKSCRISRFSNTGQYFAYCDGVKTVVIEIATAEEAISVDLPRTQKIVFSTKDHIMITYEPHVTYGPRVNGIEGRQRKPPPNMRIWTLPDGRLLAAVTAQNVNSGKMDWSDDESCALRVIGSELMIGKSIFSEKYHSKLAVPKIDDFALSRGSEPYHCAIHIRAFGGQPALTQIRKYNFLF